MADFYRLAPSDRVSRDLSNLLYNAAVALEAGYDFATGERAKLREGLITESAGALVRKPPSAVLATLVWAVEMAQARATESDFNSAREALDEHDALNFAAYWLEMEGQDVTAIRGAQLKPEARQALENQADADQAALDALEGTPQRPAPAALSAAVDTLANYMRTGAATFPPAVMEALEVLEDEQGLGQFEREE